MTGFFLLFPLGAQARVEVTREDDLGEGDPLDSNDYSGGGGGGGGSNLHEDATAPVTGDFLRIIGTIFVDQYGQVLLPFFSTGLPVIQFLVISAGDETAVPNAN